MEKGCGTDERWVGEWEELVTSEKVCVGKTGQIGFLGREGTVMRTQQESCPPDS